MTRRNNKHSVSVIQRDRSGRNRVRQTTVRRNNLSKVPLSRKRAIRISAAATSVPLKRGASRLVVKRRQGSTRIAKRNVYLVTADS